jgi:hypothetical protein
MITSQFFSNRSWPGLVPWIVTVLSSVAVFELIAVLAWKNDQGRFLDLTTAFISIPVGAVTLLVAASALWAFFASGEGKLSFTGALGWSARLLPFAWAIPLFDLVRTYGNGLVIGPPKLNGLNILLAAVTGGMLPIESGISIGIRLGIFAGAVGVGIVTWHFGKKIWMGIASGIVMSSIAVKLISTLSLLSIWKDPFNASGWTALPVEIARRATIVMSNGYWWAELYERFPTSIDAQTSIAARLTAAGFAVCTLGAVLLIALGIFIKKRWRVLAYVYRSWGTFDIVLYTAVGAVAAKTSGVITTSGATCMIAVTVAFFGLAALRFANVMKRDIARLEIDERANADKPITRGDITVEGARQMAKAGEWYALVAGWVLGWPVFACVLVYLAASHLTRDRTWSQNKWATMIYRMLGAGAIALAGMFFVTKDAKITTLALTVVVIVALHRLFIEAFWLPRVGKK